MMRFAYRLLGGLAAVAMTIGSASAAVPRPRHAAAHAASDWSRVVTVTPEGVFSVGNPKAKVTVAEFASYTCSHCAQFAAEVIPHLLTDYVKPGLVRYEFRNAVRDGYDMTAAVIARCAGPRGFLPLSDAIFAGQRGWIERGGSYMEKLGDAWNTTPVADKPRMLAEGSGLSELAAARGVPVARQKACFADPKAMEPIMTMSRDAATRQIPGTPAFLINGQLAEGVRDWPTLQARISQSLSK